MEEEAARRRGRVDPVRDAGEVNAVCFERSHELHQLANRASQTVELPHHESVAAAKVRLGSEQTRAIRSTAAGLVREEPFAAGALECVQLEVEPLVCARDAGIADLHVRDCRKTR